MEIIVSGRHCGKTTELIKRSAETGTYILVGNRNRQKQLADQARGMGINDMPYPVTLEDFRRNKFKGSYIKKIMIDDVDDIIRDMFSPLEIDAITLTKNDWDTLCLKFCQEGELP